MYNRDFLFVIQCNIATPKASQMAVNRFPSLDLLLVPGSYLLLASELCLQHVIKTLISRRLQVYSNADVLCLPLQDNKNILYQCT